MAHRNSVNDDLSFSSSNRVGKSNKLDNNGSFYGSVD